MGVSIRKGSNGAIFIQPHERFDFACYTDIHAALAEPGDIVFDLKDTTYMDSSALGMLHLAREKTMARGRGVRVTGVSGQPAQVLKMAKFEKVFDIEWR